MVYRLRFRFELLELGETGGQASSWNLGVVGQGLQMFPPEDSNPAIYGTVVGYSGHEFLREKPNWSS